MRHLFVVPSALLILVLFLSLPGVQAQQREPAAPSGAQVALGSAFTYQGRLNGPSGPVNGSLELVFGLYDAETAGSLLGAPLTQIVTLSNGLFTTQLDFGQNVFTGEARWLEISVAGTPLTPRQALTPALYALALPGLYTQQTAGTPNLIGGWRENSVMPGTRGGTIGGGGDLSGPNQVIDDYGTIGGGRNNQAGDNAGSATDQPYATVGGGDNNTASGSHSTLGGGFRNTASGLVATVGGGTHNTAAGDYSIVVGHRATNSNADHDGVFLFADSTLVEFKSAIANEFAVRATGGVRMVTAVDMFGVPTAGASLAPGSGSWSSLSDRNAKINVQTVAPQAILARLAGVPIARWSYTAQGSAVTHIGPMAQDFYAAFGVGEGDTTISMVDADGVNMAAIQGLYQISQEKDARIASLEEEMATMKAGVPTLPTWLLALFAGAALAVIGAAATCTMLALRRTRTEAV